MLAINNISFGQLVRALIYNILATFHRLYRSKFLRFIDLFLFLSKLRKPSEIYNKLLHTLIYSILATFHRLYRFIDFFVFLSKISNGVNKLALHWYLVAGKISKKKLRIWYMQLTRHFHLLSNGIFIFDERFVIVSGFF